MFHEDFDSQVMMESRQTLEKIRNKQNQTKSFQDRMQEHWSTYDKGRSFFEEYTPEIFESKMKVDLLYMDQFLQKLDNQQISEVEKLISSVYKDVKEIYEIMNVKPEIYGKNITEDIINESTEMIHNHLSKNIHSFLARNYYDLPVEKKESMYYERVKEDSADLIHENHNPKEVVAYSMKKCLMEDFVKNVCFPFSARCRLNYLLQDEAFGDVFDQESLQEHYDSFNKKLKSLSKIVAAC